MARSAWTIVGWFFVVVILLIVGIAVVVGPTVYREGRAVFKPIQVLSGIEERIVALNEDLPFEAPGDGRISETRLHAFLAIRSSLKDDYENWTDAVAEVERNNGESWTGAKKIIVLTSEVAEKQIKKLRDHEMSVTEFLWIEDLVYSDWLREIDRSPSSREQLEMFDRLKETAAEDLELIQSLKRQYGISPALARLEEHFRQRVVHLEGDPPPEIEGMNSENQELLWRYREQIVDLDFSDFPDIHNGILRSGGDSNGGFVRVNIK